MSAALLLTHPSLLSEVTPAYLLHDHHSSSFTHPILSHPSPSSACRRVPPKGPGGARPRHLGGGLRGDGGAGGENKGGGGSATRIFLGGRGSGGPASAWPPPPPSSPRTTASLRARWPPASGACVHPNFPTVGSSPVAYSTLRSYCAVTLSDSLAPAGPCCCTGPPLPRSCGAVLGRLQPSWFQTRLSCVPMRHFGPHRWSCRSLAHRV